MSDITIPFVSLASASKEALVPSILKEIEALFRSSQFILGDKVKKFEDRFAEMAGCAYAVGVNSGVDALVLSMRALGIGPAHEVITAPNSFLGSAGAIALTGARPVFADVAWDFNIDPNEVEKRITSKTRAIMPVHLTGNPCRMEEIMEIARRHQLYVIEDAAQAIGAKVGGRSAGGIGDVGCFSLHPLKNLHIWGDGGVVTTNSRELVENLRLQRNHGLRNRDESDFFSYNSRLDSIQAIVGLAFSELLSETTERRRLNARFYDEKLSGLGGVIRLPAVREGSYAVYHVYQIWTERRDELKSFLASRGIETKVHYPIPIHLQKAAEYLGYRRGDFPVTERLAQGILSLPVRENLTALERESVAEAVLEFFR